MATAEGDGMVSHIWLVLGEADVMEVHLTLDYLSVPLPFSTMAAFVLIKRC